MSKPQFAILRFAKYKGPEISNIESHNERTKEKYASNPDVDTSRIYLNFHLVTPQRKYRAEAEKQIAEAYAPKTCPATVSASSYCLRFPWHRASRPLLVGQKKGAYEAFSRPYAPQQI